MHWIYELLALSLLHPYNADVKKERLQFMKKKNRIKIKKFDVLIETKTNIVYQELRGLKSRKALFLQRSPFHPVSYLWYRRKIVKRIRRGEFKHYRGKPMLERDHLIIYDEQGNEKRIDVDFSTIE